MTPAVTLLANKEQEMSAAEKVPEDFDWTRKRGVRKSKYPWQEWFEMGEGVLTKGKHFDVSTTSMRTLIHNTAVKMGLSASVFVREEGGVEKIIYKCTKCSPKKDAPKTAPKKGAKKPSKKKPAKAGV